MKEVAGSLRLDLSQYRELEAFAAFASDLDATSKAQLERGPASSSCSSSRSTARWPRRAGGAIFLGTKGHLDSVPVEDVKRFEASSSSTFKASHDDILKNIRETRSSPRRQRRSWSRSSTTSRRASPPPTAARGRQRG